jgi:hypothetical protein
VLYNCVLTDSSNDLVLVFDKLRTSNAELHSVCHNNGTNFDRHESMKLKTSIEFIHLHT